MLRRPVWCLGCEFGERLLPRAWVNRARGPSGCVGEADRKGQRVYLPTNGATRSWKVASWRSSSTTGHKKIR